MTSEQLTGNTSEYLLVNFDKEDRYDKRNKKKKKNTQASTRQGLNPDHVPQHGAVRCSTHRAARNLSISYGKY